MSVPTAVPMGATFPVRFEIPGDSAVTYFFDPRHFPAPISSLFQSVIARAYACGFSDAVTALKLPVACAKVTIQNNYIFTAVVPMVPKSAAEERALKEAAEASIKREIPRLMERWETEYLPRVKANLERLATMNLDTVNAKALPYLIDEVVAIAKDNWSMHFKVVTPATVALQRFDELFADHFGGTEQDARTLLVGLPTESVKAGVGLSDLAGAAKAAGLDRLLLSVPAEQALAALADAPIGEYYAAAINDYLQAFGLRQDLFDFTSPTWQEDPTNAISNIQHFLRTGHDARAEHERALKAAVTALNAARAQLSAYPEAVLEQFEEMVAAARVAYFVQEDLNFYIGQRSQALTRLLFMRIGARLVRSGALARADDVFMLTLDELKRAASQTLSEAQIGALQMLVLEREGELQRSAEMVPPPFVGAAPDGPPPADDPMHRAIMRFFGRPRQEADARR